MRTDEQHAAILGAYIGGMNRGDFLRIIEAQENGWQQYLNGNAGSQVEARKYKDAANLAAIKNMRGQYSTSLEYVEKLINHGPDGQ